MKSTSSLALTALLTALLLAGCADESPDKRIAAARAHLQNKDTSAAVIELKNALQKNPDMAEARFLLGSTLLKSGDPVSAEVELRKALALKYPETVVVPELARAMLMLGQAKKLVDEFGALRFDQPAADASLQTSLSAAYSALGQTEQAQVALNAALAADPGYAEALLISARTKAAARDSAAALALAEQVIAREPGHAEAWRLKGDILLYADNKPDEALAAYRKALDGDARSMSAHASILTLLMQQGKLDEAGAQLAALKKLAPRSLQTRYFEAQLAYQKKDYKAAREVLQQLVLQTPDNPRILQTAGAVEFQLGALAQAETYLSGALRLEPGLALARRLLIATYLRSGQSAKALTELNAAAGKDGIPPALYTLAGEVYLQNGDAKRAEEFFGKALKLDPEDARKRTALALTRLTGGRSDSALDELRSIAESDSGTTADMALISAHLRAKDFGKALAAMATSSRPSSPTSPWRPTCAGRCFCAQKDSAAARRSFERALPSTPATSPPRPAASMDMADGKPQDAKKRFEALLATNPKNGQALIALAQLAAAGGAGRDEVAALLGKAVDANPNEEAPRMMLIELQVRNGDNKQALAVAQNAVAALPSSAELLGALGRVQQLSGDLNQAIATYGKLAAMQPLSPVPQLRLAEAHAANKDNEAARRSLRKALELKPDFLDAQRRLILLALDAKNYQEALTIARTVQQQRPKDGVGLGLEGDVKAVQKDWGAATAAYKLALQQGNSPALAIKLHNVLAASGQTAQADAWAAKWLDSNPKDAQFRNYLAESAIVRKDYAAAEKGLAAVLQLQPDNALALNNMAWVGQQLGRADALSYAEKANRLLPNRPQFMDTQAMLLSAKGEYAKAIELQTRALALQPANDALKLNLAKIYIAAGDKTRARVQLDALASQGNNKPSQQEASALLKTL